MKGPLVSSVFATLSLFNSCLGATNSTNTTSSYSSSLLSSGHVQLGVASEAYEKAKAFVSSLTNSQKVSIITGSDVDGDNVTWTALATKDGAAGINMNFYVSGFTLPSALAMTWNRSLFEEQFKATGDEFYESGSNLIDGPVSSPLGRVVYSGRLPEGFTPDPYLNGIAMGEAITAMNSAGIITVGRHFLFNEQETNRTRGGYSSNVDDKTTREVYLWPFADGVKAGMMGVMCSMNKVNGTIACENDDLLNNYLKTELGFPGLVYPDVNAQTTSYGSANYGLDKGSSSLWTDTILEAGIANGSFTQERLDDMAIRNVIGYYFVGLDNGEQPAVMGTTEYRDVRGNHSEIIRRVGAESLVLLKNNNDDGTGRANSAVCLVFLNSDSGEGGDRSELVNTDQDTMVTSVADNCNNTIVVINTAGPRLLDAWIEHDNVTAVVYGGLLGEQSGNAIADVLYGAVNPSGRLTYTLPKNESDYPSGFNVCESSECDYDEGVYIDYRYFDAENITVRYPFGYGLSYTNFTYSSDVTASVTNTTSLASGYATGAMGLGGPEDLWDEVVTVSTSVSNTGSLDGAEVAQLYVTFPDEAEQPIRVLRGFEKVAATVGESADVTFTLRKRDLSYWDTTAQKWAVASGDYTLAVGASSRDIRASTTLTV
ncbi:glycoside hydrolase superfamily [Xylariales sp. AK1849]|nr:glycoside hydrolase superfamily [Xylariales sp. AK1849]